MPHCRLLSISVLVAFATFPVYLFSAPPHGDTSPVIHVLIVADTQDPKIGKGVQADLNLLETFFTDNVSKPGLDLVTIEPERVTREEILRAIDRFRCRSADAIAFFWSGHGAYDVRGHYFATHTGSLYRNDVMTHLKNRGAGLTSLISDCCNVYVAGAVSCEAIAKAPGTATLIEHLFLRSRGTVNINGASEDECSFCDPVKNGAGTFFGPFVESALTYRHKRLDWSDFVTVLRPEVQQAFDKVNPNGFKLPNGKIQRAQTVRVWGNLPAPVGGEIRVSRHISLERGDLILSVNGQPVRGPQACIEAVLASPMTINLQVRDVRNGVVRNLRGEILPSGRRQRLGITLDEGKKDSAVVTSVSIFSPAKRLLETE